MSLSFNTHLPNCECLFISFTVSCFHMSSPPLPYPIFLKYFSYIYGHFKFPTATYYRLRERYIYISVKRDMNNGYRVGSRKGRFRGRRSATPSLTLCMLPSFSFTFIMHSPSPWNIHETLYLLYIFNFDMTTQVDSLIKNNLSTCTR